MSYTTQDLIALGNEINTNASAYYPAGGVVNTANDEANANAINLQRESIAVKKTSLASSQIAAAISPGDHEALSTAQARWLKDCVLDVGNINPSTAENVVSGIAERLGNTPSGAAIAALFNRPGNRLEQLYQAGVISEVGNFTPSTPSQIRAALV